MDRQCGGLIKRPFVLDRSEYSTAMTTKPKNTWNWEPKGGNHANISRLQWVRRKDRQNRMRGLTLSECGCAVLRATLVRGEFCGELSFRQEEKGIARKHTAAWV